MTSPHDSSTTSLIPTSLIDNHEMVWEDEGKQLVRGNEFYEELYNFMNFDFTRSIAKKYLLSRQHSVMFLMFLELYSTFEQQLSEDEKHPARGRYKMIAWLHRLLTEPEYRDVRHQLIGRANDIVPDVFSQEHEREWINISKEQKNVTIPTHETSLLSTSDIASSGGTVIYQQTCSEWKAVHFDDWNLSSDELAHLLEELASDLYRFTDRHPESMCISTEVRHGTITMYGKRCNTENIACFLSVKTYERLHSRISLNETLWTTVKQ